MKFGVTINVGNYNSIRCESSDRETIYECYHEVFLILTNWAEEFDSVKWWIDKLNKNMEEIKK